MGETTKISGYGQVVEVNLGAIQKTPLTEKAMADGAALAKMVKQDMAEALFIDANTGTMEFKTYFYFTSPKTHKTVISSLPSHAMGILRFMSKPTVATQTILASNAKRPATATN